MLSDAFGCHGIGGIWGGITTGIFADSSSVANPVARWDGLIFGDFHLFAVQIAGILVTIRVFMRRRNADLRGNRPSVYETRSGRTR